MPHWNNVNERWWQSNLPIGCSQSGWFVWPMAMRYCTVERRDAYSKWLLMVTNEWQRWIQLALGWLEGRCFADVVRFRGSWGVVEGFGWLLRAAIVGFHFTQYRLDCLMTNSKWWFMNIRLHSEQHQQIMIAVLYKTKIRDRKVFAKPDGVLFDRLVRRCVTWPRTRQVIMASFHAGPLRMMLPTFFRLTLSRVACVLCEWPNVTGH